MGEAHPNEAPRLVDAVIEPNDSGHTVGAPQVEPAPAGRSARAATVRAARPELLMECVNVIAVREVDALRSAMPEQLRPTAPMPLTD